MTCLAGSELREPQLNHAGPIRHGPNPRPERTLSPGDPSAGASASPGAVGKRPEIYFLAYLYAKKELLFEALRHELPALIISQVGVVVKLSVGDPVSQKFVYAYVCMYVSMYVCMHACVYSHVSIVPDH